MKRLKLFIVGLSAISLTFGVLIVMTTLGSPAVLAQTGGSIHGMKWNDWNGNGQRDPDEPGLPGWVIVLEGTGISLETETDELGRYWFEGLSPGEYTVAEAIDQTWLQTFPATPGTHVVNVAENQAIEGVDFGNKQASIHGTKWADLDGDGQQGPNELVLPGWPIILEGPEGFVADTVTDDFGHYWFMDLPPGEYTVAERLEPGWVQTFPPEPGTHTIGLGVGEVVDGVDFGNQPESPNIGSIHGMKWADLNGNGEKDNDEPPLAGWPIILEGPDGLIIDTATEDSGHYWFVELAPGDYKVTEFHEPGWVQTFPADPGVHNVSLTGGDVVLGLDFGNKPEAPDLASIHGIKWADLDGDGHQDLDEPPLSGWPILLEGNGFIQETFTDDFGHYWFMDLLPGEYTVSEVLEPDWRQTWPPPSRYT